MLINRIRKIKKSVMQASFVLAVFYIALFALFAVNRVLSAPEKHQLRIARITLRMPNRMVRVMGVMTKQEAREIVKSLTGK